MEFKTELRDGTVVTFAGGSLSETATLGFVAKQNGQWIVITDRSPFHPLSLTWPDQPGDRGWIATDDGREAAILDCHEALLNSATGDLFSDADAHSLRRTDPAMRSVVAHLMDEDIGLAQQIGQSVTLHVDPDYRAALSLNHTGVHLASLALNQCAAPFWTKDYADADCLGFPNFDKAAVTRSSIDSYSATDDYRIGKSLRKRGFDRDAFLSDLPARILVINKCLHDMLIAPAPATVTPGAGYLDERRLWSTQIQGAQATIFCGGTHISELSQIAEITVQLAMSEDGFVMATKSSAR